MTAADRQTAFLFPGQGSQHPGMAVDLYGDEPVFTAVMDEFFDLLGADGRRLRARWLAADPGPALDDGASSQPLLYGVGLALARTLADRGVRPDVLLGHSVGELTAATVADVLDLPSAAAALAARCAALATAPPGGMLAVAASTAELTVLSPVFDHRVAIGAVNAPRQTVLAGPEEALRAAERVLRERNIPCRRVRAAQPFHSPAMDEAAALMAEALAGAPLRPPAVPIRSTCTGLPVTPALAADPGFWAGQLAEPVLYWPALDALLAERPTLLVEVGPGQELTTLARRHPAVRAGRSAVLPLLPPGRAGTREHWRAALASLDALDVSDALDASDARTAVR